MNYAIPERPACFLPRAWFFLRKTLVSSYMRIINAIILVLPTLLHYFDYFGQLLLAFVIYNEHQTDGTFPELGQYLPTSIPGLIDSFHFLA